MTIPLEKDLSKTSAFNHKHELAGIEILRFLCAVAVLIWHYQHFFFLGEFDNTQAQFRPVQPFYGLLQLLYERGYLAVSIFWGISGFIFYWRYAHQIFHRRVGLFEFAIRRFSRLYPLHITTLMIVALLQYLYFRSHEQYFIYANNSSLAFIEQLFLASNWFKGHALSFNGPIWSVSVEILVYFAFFAIVRIIGPSPGAAVAVCVLSVAVGHAKFAFVPFEDTLLQCAVFFFAGGLAQWLSRQRLGLLFCLCVGAPMGALLYLGRIPDHYSFIAILIACSIAIFARIGESKLGSVLKPLMFLGNATYSSYLVHFPIQLGLVIIVDRMGYNRAIFFTPIMFIMYMTLVIGISITIFNVFELPAQTWIRRFVGRRQASPAKALLIP
jgi:peptidoglycan/LPS O-acetylase OafA/YrhL